MKSEKSFCARCDEVYCLFNRTGDKEGTGECCATPDIRREELPDGGITHTCIICSIDWRRIRKLEEEKKKR